MNKKIAVISKEKYLERKKLRVYLIRARKFLLGILFVMIFIKHYMATLVGMLCILYIAGGTVLLRAMKKQVIKVV